MCKNPSVKDIYIDYTTDITRRKYFHKIKAVNPKNNKYKLYDFINTHGGFDNFDIIEIEKIPCADSSEAKRIKYDFINSLNSTLNGNICNPYNDEDNEQEYEEHNEYRIINLEKARRIKNKNYILRKQLEEEIINKRMEKLKEKDEYNDKLDEIRREKKQVKKELLLQQEIKELNKLKSELNSLKPDIGYKQLFRPSPPKQQYIYPLFQI